MCGNRSAGKSGSVPRTVAIGSNGKLPVMVFDILNFEDMEAQEIHVFAKPSQRENIHRKIGRLAVHHGKNIW